MIDGKFFVNGYEATNLIVDFLRESNRPFTCVPGARLPTQSEFSDISETKSPDDVSEKIGVGFAGS